MNKRVSDEELKWITKVAKHTSSTNETEAVTFSKAILRDLAADLQDARAQLEQAKETYRRQGLEEAAQECMKIATRFHHDFSHYAGEGDRENAARRLNMEDGAGKCYDAIRARIDTAEEG